MLTRRLVSGIIIFLNGEEFIQEAIESVLAQTYGHWELLLVDDGSTDRSHEIALRYAEQHADKIRYLEHEGHRTRGMSSSRNLGLRHARGEYIAFLDHDDIWLPSKLEDQVAILEAKPEAGMMYARTRYWHSWTGMPTDREKDHEPDLGVPCETLFEPPTLLTLLYPLGAATAPCICSLLIRREAIDRVGGFEESFMGFYEDQAFLTKVYLTEPVYVSSGCWDRYRIHPASCSAIVRQTGQYDLVRQSFLEWFKGYLLEHATTDLEAWKAIDRAFQPYRDSLRNAEAEYVWLRLLRVTDGNAARLLYLPETLNRVRIAIAKAATRTSHDIQLNQPRLKVKSGCCYVVNFAARADSPRSIGIGIAKAHAPWTNLGLYRQIELTSDWQDFEEYFIVTETEENARIHFDVGGSDISVELSSVALRSLSEDKLVKPELTPKGSHQPVLDQLTIDPPVEFGKVQFGSLRRVTPISQDFGCDRGRPIDRYYIENFLECHERDIRGRVLEIGDNTYTRRFGGERVAVSDVLHVIAGEPQATIIADLASADHIPSDTFDCIILTQTLQLIYDVRAALKTVYRILRPSGVLLATFPGISQTNDSEWGDNWYWNFTSLSARRLFEELFSAPGLEIEVFGNVLAAISFLHGLAVEELSAEELDCHEPGYEVTIAVRAEKSGADDQVKVVARSQQPARLGESFECKPLILMYHRVAEGCSDPWSLCVSPQHFTQHLEVLRKHFRPIQLHELVAALSSGGLPPRAVAVTFDDGYSDNLHNAKPLLERYQIPATVFVTSGYVGAQREFWWDDLERILLQAITLPEILSLSIRETEYQWELGEAYHFTKEYWRHHRSWKAPENSPSARHALYVELWRLFQPLADIERRKLLSELMKWAGVEPGTRASHRTLSVEEVISLGQGGLIEIGSHTVTHPLIIELSAPLQWKEIRGSKTKLEEILHQPVTSFSYPFGAYAPEIIPIVRQAGFVSACSTIESPVRSDTDPFQLPRVEIKDWDGEEFDHRIHEWLT